MNFVDLIYDALKRKPDAELIHWPTSTGYAVSTSSDLLSDITLKRSIFRMTGFQKGKHIMLLQPLSPEIIGIMIALMAEGCAVVFPPSGGGLKFLLKSRQLAKIDGVVLAPGASKMLRLTLWIMRFKTLRFSDRAKALTPPAYQKPQGVADEDLALISFSSGSTGESRPIYRSHGVLRAQHETIGRQFPSFEGQLDLPLFPNILLHHLATGSACVIPDIPNWKLNELDPERIFSQIEKLGVNTLTGNVYYFKALTSAAKGRTFEKVQACGIGGSPVPEFLLESVQGLFPKATIYVIYGATEAEPIAVRPYENSASRWGWYRVGKPIEGIELRLENAASANGDDKTSIGEVQVRGAHVISGSNSWHATGDFGYLNDGELFLTGRKGNETTIEGWQHYMIEHGLSSIEGLAQVAAIPRANAFDIHFSGPCDNQELKEALSQKLPNRIIGKITKHKALPTDRRHLSKILYRQI